MFKKMSIVLMVLALPLALSAKDKSQRSLKFGGDGVNTLARVHVYVDKNEPAPKCKCVRFSVLVDDRQPGLARSPAIDQVVVLVGGLNLDPGSDDSASRVLTPWAVWRSPDSPERTPQFVVEVPIDQDLASVSFRVLALRSSAVHVEHDIVIDTQGQFTGADVTALKASSVEDLLKEKSK